MRGTRKGYSKYQRYEKATSLASRRTSVVKRLTPGRQVGLIVVGVLLLVAALAAWVVFDDRFRVEGAQVMGAIHTSPQAVLEASAITGRHVLRLAKDEAVANIEALDRVARADIRCRFPARCTIGVVERRPWVLWGDESRLQWIDREGVVFPVTSSNPLEETELVVNGPIPLDGQGRVEARARAGLDELWRADPDLSAVTYARGQGFVLTDERGWRVILGQGRGMVERLRLAGRLAEDLERRGIRPAFIDVRFADAPYYAVASAP